MLTAAVDNAQSMSFSPDNISAKGTDGMFELGICANEGYYNLPWYLVSIKGEHSENMSLIPLEKGVLVEGDNLNDMIITSKDKDGNTQQNSFPTEYRKVIEQDRMVVKADADNDGTFETNISDMDGQKSICISDECYTSCGTTLYWQHPSIDLRSNAC